MTGPLKEGRNAMNILVKCLVWPVIALLVIGGTHLVAEGIRPQLEQLIGTAVVMPIHLVAGGWAAYMVWIADHRKSQTLALFSVLLAYYTAVITRVGQFTLYSNLVLTLAAVFFLVRNRWVRPGIPRYPNRSRNRSLQRRDSQRCSADSECRHKRDRDLDHG